MQAQTDGFFHMVTRASFLNHVLLFKRFSPSYLAGVARITCPVDIDAGQVLFRQSDFADSMYIIREGTVGILIDGRRVVTMGRFECLGELSILSDPYRSATAVADTHARFLKIRANDFKSLLTLHPGMSVALMRTLAERLRQREACQFGG